MRARQLLTQRLVRSRARDAGFVRELVPERANVARERRVFASIRVELFRRVLQSSLELVNLTLQSNNLRGVRGAVRGVAPPASPPPPAVFAPAGVVWSAAPFFSFATRAAASAAPAAAPAAVAIGGSPSISCASLRAIWSDRRRSSTSATVSSRRFPSSSFLARCFAVVSRRRSNSRPSSAEPASSVAARALAFSRSSLSAASPAPDDAHAALARSTASRTAASVGFDGDGARAKRRHRSPRVVVEAADAARGAVLVLVVLVGTRAVLIVAIARAFARGARGGLEEPSEKRVRRRRRRGVDGDGSGRNLAGDAGGERGDVCLEGVPLGGDDVDALLVRRLLATEGRHLLLALRDLGAIHFQLRIVRRSGEVSRRGERRAEGGRGARKATRVGAADARRGRSGGARRAIGAARRTGIWRREKTRARNEGGVGGPTGNAGASRTRSFRLVSLNLRSAFGSADMAASDDFARDGSSRCGAMAFASAGASPVAGADALGQGK